MYQGDMMKCIKHTYWLAALVVLTFLVSGCATFKNYGKIRPQPKAQMTIETLQDKWKDYLVSYSGNSDNDPGAVIFDRKDDDRFLSGDRWTAVEDERTLSRLIGIMKTWSTPGPKLFKILGPDDHLYGYLYSLRNTAVFKVIDAKGMYAFGIEPPHPLLPFGGDALP
jgi:hypothetical protein